MYTTKIIIIIIIIVDRITRGNKYGVNVQNPSLDYVPPELVSLLLTNS